MTDVAATQSAQESAERPSSGPIVVLDKVVDALGRLAPITRWLSIVGASVFVLCLLYGTLNVIMRYAFDRAIPGSVEVIEIMMAVVVFTGVAYLQWGKAHITMDLVTSKVSVKPRLVLEATSNALCVGLLVLLVWQTGARAYMEDKVTGILGIPLEYGLWLVPVCLGLTGVLFVRDYLSSLRELVVLRSKWWIGGILVPLAVFGLVAWVLEIDVLSAVSLPTLGIIGLAVMFAVFLIGMPVGLGMMGIGFIFMSIIRGESAGFNVLGSVWYNTVASYSWSPMMFFILMGYFCLFSDLGVDLFLAARRFLGHFRGGLAMGVVGACAAFGAVVGDSLSGSITMNAIASPEMKKYRYDDKLSLGVLTASGTIGTLIPPSVSFVIYSILTDESIGDLFMAGIIPGLVCTVVFMAAVYAICVKNPAAGPRIEKVAWGERLKSLKAAGPVGVLFILVIGGMYVGIFTPTEGAIIGAFGSLVIGLIMRRFTWSRLVKAMTESNKSIGIAFSIIPGAMFLGYFLVQSTLPTVLVNWVTSYEMGSVAVMTIIIAIYFVLGMFIPTLPMILITVPMFLPIAKSFGWDLVWFGVIVTLMANMSAITPPFGINLFVMQGVTGYPMGKVFRSITPFVIALLIVVALIVAVPALSTWLPGLVN